IVLSKSYIFHRHSSCFYISFYLLLFNWLSRFIMAHDGLKWLMIAGVSFRDGVITDELSRTDIAMARRELSMLVEMGKQVMPRHCFGGA
ncbi:TPA: hypothetical protein ACG58N_004370, partial [Escherichia coli]